MQKKLFPLLSLIYIFLAGFALTSKPVMAEDLQSSLPQIKCGPRPSGSVLNRTKVSKEIAGPRFTVGVSGSKTPSEGPVTFEKRQIIIKGSKCWVELSVVAGDFQPKSASESFSKSILGGDDMRKVGAAAYCYSKDLLKLISDNSNYEECRELAYPRVHSKSGDKITFNRDGVQAYRDCERKALAGLDQRGFVGYYSITAAKAGIRQCYVTFRGFALFDGKIILLNVDKK